jgi:phospholipid-translocating ATPase
MGNLKDELGIQHRNAKKNKKREFAVASRRGSSSEVEGSHLEAAPMFLEPHSRSMSELSGADVPFEETKIGTPQSSPYIGGSEGLSSPLLKTRQSPSPLGQSPVLVNSMLAPGSGGRVDAVSPQPSYYSVSELPPPSPQPLTKFRLASGEVMMSGASSGMNYGSTSPPPPIVIHESEGGLALIGGAGGLIRRLSGSGSNSGGGSGSGENEVYEMRVRSPPQLHPHPQLSPPSSPRWQQPQPQYEESRFEQQQSASRAESSTSFVSQSTSGYATAEEEDEQFWLEDGGGEDLRERDGAHQRRQSDERVSEETARPSYDRDTIMGVAGVVGQQHDRQISAASSSTAESWNVMGSAV